MAENPPPRWLPDDRSDPGRPVAHFTRWRDSPLDRLTRGQQVTITCGDFNGEYRVTGVETSLDGDERYTLVPASKPDGV